MIRPVESTSCSNIPTSATVDECRPTRASSHDRLVSTVGSSKSASTTVTLQSEMRAALRRQLSEERQRRRHLESALEQQASRHVTGLIVSCFHLPVHDAAEEAEKRVSQLESELKTLRHTNAEFEAKLRGEEDAQRGQSARSSLPIIRQSLQISISPCSTKENSPHILTLMRLAIV